MNRATDIGLFAVVNRPGGKDKRPTRTLGIADNDHLLTLRLPEDRATIMRTSIADGTHWAA